MENIFHMWWPVLCIVFSDVIYQICAKKMSTHTDPLAALGITYLVSAGVCVLLYTLSGGRSFTYRARSCTLACCGYRFIGDRS